MSMEGGWDLDFPEDDPMVHSIPELTDLLHRPEPEIGEPDAASIDEIPKPMVTLDNVLEQAGDINYWYLVESDTSNRWKRWYAGHIVADAIAAYTTAILDGAEYVMLESLRMPDGPSKD